MNGGDDVIAFISFDNAFATAAAALVGSIRIHKSKDYFLRLYVCDVGIAPRVKRRIEKIAEGPDFGIVWLSQDQLQSRRIRDIYTRARTYYPPAAYSRLIIGDILPKEVGKVIYLDTDMICRADLRGLWTQEISDNVMLAAIDPLVAVKGSMTKCGVPSNGADPDLRYGDFLGRLLADAGDETYRFSGEDDYFQSGVLMIDLEKYRAIDAASQLLHITSRYPDLRFPDQDALNIALRGRIGKLDPRWNMVGTLYGFDSYRDSPFGQEVFEQVLADPWIVHFTSRPKPWHLGCRHPFLGEWNAALDATPWRNWRPSKFNQFLARAPRGARILAKKLRRSLVQSDAAQ